MKKLLSLLLVALLAIGALSLAACFPGETPDNGGEETPASEPSIEDAKEFLLGFLEDEATVTPSDYTLPAQVKVGDYTYTVTWTANREDITITVDGNVAKIDLNEKTPEAFEYTLTATISYGDLTPATITRTCSVPAYEVLSYEDYVALTKGEVATIEGVIVMINSKDAGNKYNRITLVDANGNNGYYCHNLKKDPIKDLGLEIGMTVSVTGTTDDYNGMRQLKDGEVKILNAEKTETPAVDVTAAFAAGTDLNGYIGNLVTIKGVTIGRQVLGGTNEYLYFSLGTVEGYLRTYVTDFPHTMSHAATENADKNTIDAFHAANFGNTADVTGVLVRYNANFYLVPMTTTPFTNITVVELSDEDKVDATLDEVTFEESLSSDKVIEVALTGKAFNTVTLAWASNNAAIVYADGKLTVTIPEDETTVEITVTATLGEVTKTKTFTVKLSKSITPVKDVLAVANTKEHNTYTSEKYIIAGVISGITGDYGNCYVTDESGATIYVYGLYINGTKYGQATDAKPVNGNYVVLTGVVGTYNGTAQMKNADLMSFSTVTSVADAIALGAAKDHNTFTEETYVITGVVESIANTTYGNLYIQDADGNKIYVYGLYDQSGTRFDKMANQPKVGDTITVVSVVGNFNGAQLKNATVVCIVAATTDDDNTGDDNTGDTTEHTCADANGDFKCDTAGCTEKVLPAEGTTLTIAQALALGKLFAHDEYTGVYTEAKYYVTGVISDVYGTTYGNMKIVDENNNEFTVYGLYSADGATRYDAMTVKPVKGDTITVYGVIGAYQQTAQMNNGYLQSHTAHTHDYADATCILPKKCTVCGGFDGEALGHNYEAGVCTRCNEAEPSDDQAPKSYVLSVVSDGTTYYVSGITTSKTLSITTNKAEALTLYFEATATPEVYNIYYLDGTAKKYIAMSSNSTKVMTTVTDPTADGASWKFDTTKQQIVNTTYNTRAFALYNNSDIRTYATSQTYTWVWYTEL